MTTLTRQDLNFGRVVADVLCEFLEVAVHLILYVREVYPSGIFQKRKKYNVPVQMSCHPDLNQYIQDTLLCIKPLIEKNDAEKVVVVIMDKDHRPVERFVFEISQPPLLSISSDCLLSHVEQLLRAFILKISVCDAVLSSNPPAVWQRFSRLLQSGVDVCEQLSPSIHVDLNTPEFWTRHMAFILKGKVL
ncbi:mitotic spindle assembly checkpoint protein MAD2B isoform X2 [Oryzias latipes]